MPVDPNQPTYSSPQKRNKQPSKLLQSLLFKARKK